MGGIDKFLNSAERKGIITIIKKPIKYKTIIIDTEYFLKTGIKRELKDKKDKVSTLKKRYYNTYTKEEWIKKKQNTILKNNIKSSIYYYKNKEKIKLQRRERYLKDKEKEKQRYKLKREYYNNRAKINYKLRKDKKKLREYYKNNILNLINNAST